MTRNEARNTRRAHCPSCCDDNGKTGQEKSESADGEKATWRCQNCGHQMPRRVSACLPRGLTVADLRAMGVSGF